MSAAKAIFSRLTDPATQTGPLVSTRVFPKISPEAFNATYPQIIYDLGERDAIRNYTDNTGLNKQTVSVACVDATYAGMDALAEAVRADLDNQAGTWGGVVVQGAFVETETEATLETDEQGEQKILYLRELEVSVWFNAG